MAESIMAYSLSASAAKCWNRRCHVVERRCDELHIGCCQAATPAALRHASNASARKSRWMRAVVRWRGTVKVL
jgi:hypothetical protein